MTTICSTRPLCPLCKGILPGELLHDKNNTLLTHCPNSSCKARVHLDQQWKVIYAERHYWPDGSLI